MATTKIHRITTTLTKAIDYIENTDKTNDTLLVSGYGCSPKIAAIEFEQVRKNAMKPGGTLAFHLIQSFAPGEVNYDTAHKIGTELADKILKDKFQYIIATHIDKGHIHNHIIFNSVSFADYSKFHSTASTYRFIKKQSDFLCKENGLSIIDKPKNRGKSYYEYLLHKRGLSWKSKLRQVIDFCILKARDWDEFLFLMEKEEYEIKQGKYISFRAKEQQRFTRSKTLGENYTEDSIRKRIAGEYIKSKTKNPNIKKNLIIDIENNIKAQQFKGYENWAKKYNLRLVAETVNYLSENNILDLDVLDEKISELSSKYSEKRTKIKKVEKHIKILEEQIHNIGVYRKTKPIVNGCPRRFGIDKYKREHETEFILYTAAERALKKSFGDKKMPLIKELRAEQRKIKVEKNKLISEIHNEKAKLNELKNMRKNIDLFLGVSGGQEQEKQRKREEKLFKVLS